MDSFKLIIIYSIFVGCAYIGASVQGMKFVFSFRWYSAGILHCSVRQTELICSHVHRLTRRLKWP